MPGTRKEYSFPKSSKISCELNDLIGKRVLEELHSYVYLSKMNMTITVRNCLISPNIVPLNRTLKKKGRTPHENLIGELQSCQEKYLSFACR